MALMELKLPASIADPPAGPSTAIGDARAAGLLEAARGGDRIAFGALVRAFQGLVFGVALRICGQRADAEEVAQDAFLQLYRQLPSLDDEQHLRHWLLRTVSHRAIDRLRQRGRRPAGGGDDFRLAQLAAPEPCTGDPLLARALDRLLASLAGPARAVLVLRFQEDLDPADIAAALDMPVNTVKSHLRRSLDWLRTAAPELSHEP
jgi:RNA polymerase sigma-70 factor, ECF subfamily